MSLGDTITLDWDNNAYDGDELLEIFRRVTTGPGPWSKVKTIMINGAASQTTPVGSLAALTEYDFAMRSQRGGLYRPGWGSANPELWSDGGLEAGARVEAVPTSAEAPNVTNCAWYRQDAVEHRIGLNWDAGPEGCTVEIERGLDGIDFDPHDESAADDTDYQDLFINAEAGVRYYYRLRFKRGLVVGAWSDVVSAWAGPLPSVLDDVYYAVRNGTDDGGLTFYDEWGFVFHWPTNPTYQGVQVIQIFVDDVGYPYLGDGSRPGGALVMLRVGAYDFCGVGPLDAKIRTKQTFEGVDDFSEYSTIADAVECDNP